VNLDDRLVQELRQNEYVLQVVEKNDLENSYLELKGLVKTMSGFVSPLRDAFDAKKILSEFGIKTGKVVYKNYGNKTYIVFRGYPGDRKILTGTKYLPSNPKVIRMAIGPKEY